MRQTKISMRKTIDVLKAQLVGLGDNINDDLVSNIRIEYNCQQTPLQQFALISQRDRRISIVPYEQSVVNAVAKELEQQGFDAYVFSKTTVVVNIPLASGDARREVALRKSRLGEEAKVAIRNIRKNLRKKSKDHDAELQTLTDASINEINELVSK